MFNLSFQSSHVDPACTLFVLVADDTRTELTTDWRNLQFPLLDICPGLSIHGGISLQVYIR